MSLKALQRRHTYRQAPSDEPGYRQSTEPAFDGTDGDNKSPISPTSGEKLFSKRAHGDAVQSSTNRKSASFLKSYITQKRLSGWRAGAQSAALLAFLSLVINLTAIVWLKSHPANNESGLVEVFQGSCSTVSRMNTWVHLLINIMSTLLLSGTNYCMQCLCAPTRREIDKAHAQSRFLDIGVQSYHNLFSKSLSQQLMWLILVISSVPLHIMYFTPNLSSCND